MSIEYDESKSRAPQVGALIHAAIGLIASETLSPTPARIMSVAGDCVDRFPRIEGRAHRQNVAAGTAAYFARLLPPPAWLFHGTEVHLGHGRLDLLWTDARDRILIDEVKTGYSRSLHLQRTRDQVEGYRACASDTWGDRFAGVRLLSTGDPFESLLVPAAGDTVGLFTTAFVRGA
jgi:hypothetical protein